MNKLYFGDCLDVLKELHKEHPEGFIDLIYIDPPFNSKRDYNILFEDVDLKDTTAQKQAFADTWSNVSYYDTIEELQVIDLNLSTYLRCLDVINIPKSAVAYLTTMAVRIWYMHKVLKKTGSFFLHCDPTMSHYLKIICDLIFDEKNFRNEIVWCYYGASSPGQKQFPRKHDIIFWYSRGNAWTFNSNEVRVPYKETTLKRAETTPTSIFHGIRTKRTLHEKGKIIEDYWFIPAVVSTAKERLGYPTQKPEALLERIINASTQKDDIVADFFCGCGTTIAVAQRLKRNWIGADISHLAIKLVKKRILDPYKPNVDKYKEINDDIEIHGIPKDIASAKELAQNIKGGRLDFQEWIIELMIGGVCNPKLTADGGWDGHITFETIEGKQTVLIEVKSGHVNVKNIREFIQVVEKQKAQIGVFVCFRDEMTKEMEREAKAQGYYNKGVWGSKYDKIQILTVEDLLEGKQVKMPVSEKTTFKKASKSLESTTEQKGIFE